MADSRAGVIQELDVPRSSWLILCLASTHRALLSLQLHGQATILRFVAEARKRELGSRTELLTSLWRMQ